MYKYIKDLPIIVENKKTGKELFIVKKLGGDNNEISTKNIGK